MQRQKWRGGLTVQGRYYEDFEIGQKLVTYGRTVFDADVCSFIGLANLYEELFMNKDYAETKSIFKRRIAPGMLTLTIAEGLVVQQGWLHGTGMAFLGMDELRIPAPVAVGDTIRVEVEPIEKRETRQPDRGIVKWRHTVKNQHDETVMTYTVTRMIKRRG